MNELKKTAAMIVTSVGIMAGNAQAATPHPLTVGLRTVELSCAAEGGDDPALTQSFEDAYCAEMASRLGERLGVAVESVRDAGPAAPGALPRAGVIWVRSLARLTAEAAIASSEWGSYMLQRGVPASEEGRPVTQPLQGMSMEAAGRALAGAVVGQMPFVANG